MTLALFFVGFLAVALAIGVGAARSPIGYEDADGFHFGHPRCLGTDAARTIVKPSARDEYRKPEKDVIEFPAVRILWARPAMGLAALFIMLLVLLPEKPEKSRPLTFSKNSILLESKARPNRPRVNPTHGESSKLIQRLCQRFDQAE